MMQKIELSWIDVEERVARVPLIRVELSEDAHLPETPVRCVEATLAVCSNPRCDCSDVHFQWLPPKPDSLNFPFPQPRDFWFSINENSIQLPPESEKDPDALRLGEILSAELTEDLRVSLRDWFLAAKLAVIETTPIDKHDISDLPDASDGQMIGFTDIFPCGLALHFYWDDEYWAVDEQYCVQYGCTCSETILSFLRLMDADGNKATSIRRPPALRYNYVTQGTQTVTRGPAGSPPLSRLLEELQRAYPHLDAQLERHHLILQNLYLRQERERLELQVAARKAAVLSPRIGRNEPCPCGSGLKYKRCCLNKPSQASPLPIQSLSPPASRISKTGPIAMPRKRDTDAWFDPEGDLEEEALFVSAQLDAALAAPLPERVESDEFEDRIRAAFETEDPAEQAVALLEVVAEDPGCTDVWLKLVLVLDLEPEEEISFLERIVKLAERRLGTDIFETGKGHFWGIFETRPYMRAMGSLAEAYDLVGRYPEAAGVWSRILELNPNDNQGARYQFLCACLGAGDLPLVRKLFRDYNETGHNVVFSWGKVLERLLAEDTAGAEAALAAARKQNPHMEDFLDAKEIPLVQPPFYSPGSKDEALSFAFELGTAWVKHPAALGWLRAHHKPGSRKRK